MKLQQVAQKNPDYDKSLDLSSEIASLRKMIDATTLATADALGIGGLLSDTWFLTRLPHLEIKMLERLLVASLQSLQAFVQHDKSLSYPASYRLAFRELGLAIGLEATQKMGKKLREPFSDFLPLGEEIIAFWSDEANQKSETWQEHLDINTVMLATALAPDGYLGGRS
ncbi:MAG TPA: hypothetical protein ENK93_02360 [Campylobacteraceae bacterium]|nr:hypothetical protein [Campylobacteraceae bacterium]